ncbi:sensor histidine kinase [Flaviaesturariibacter amylovorans]|uniref:histidine kinase n=1 Tax=Flaviaesturariibacter amylovorans TaxID=1084520 RepID=A0ABP8H1S0_9BACT
MSTHSASPLGADPNMTGLFMQAPALIMILEGAELRCTFANPLFEKLYEGRQLVGRTPREVAPELAGQGYFEMLDSVYATGTAVYGYEFPGVADWKNEGRDSTIYFNMVYAPYLVDGRTAGVMIFGFEVTAQVLARQRAEREEERLKRMLNALPQMAWTATPEGFVQYLNERWYAYTGQAPEEALGGGWAGVVPENEQPALLARWRQCLAAGTTYEAEMRYRRHDGVLRWHSARAEAIRDTDGTILYWLGVSTDIHEQKSFAETLEALVSERTLALKRSNEELGQFAYIASHDLKEPLRKILFFADALERGLPESQLPTLHRIQGAALRMRNLVEDLLEFSSVQQQSLHLSPVDLNEVLTASLQDHELRIQELGAVISAGTLPTVPGVPHQLLQLFTNLVGNALKYSKPGVPPELRIHAGRASESDLKRFPDLDSRKEYHAIVFSDRGIGFDPGEAERIFTLFQRLHGKGSYSGTGVGLALCRKVARGHGGEIWATGQPGEGAEFHVLLPA